MRWHRRTNYHGTREYTQDQPACAHAFPATVGLAGLRHWVQRVLTAFSRPRRLFPAADSPPSAAAPGTENWNQLDRWADEGGAIAPPPMPRGRS